MAKRISLYDVKLERHYELPLQERIILGRVRGESDVAIHYKKGINDEIEFVSGAHCELTRHDLGEEVLEDPEKTEAFCFLSVRDLNSKNGTFVNDARIHSDKETPLRNNDVLSLASYHLEVIVGDE